MSGFTTTSCIPTTSNNLETDADCDLDITNVEYSLDTNIEVLRNCAATFVAKMYSSLNSTLSDVQKSITCTKELLDKTLDLIQEKMMYVLNKYSVPQSELAVQCLLDDFETARNMFKEVNTPNKMT